MTVADNLAVITAAGNTANVAFAAYNAKGGYTGKLADGTTPTNGLKVELVNYDDAGNALNSIDLTTKLIDEDEVFAIVGNVGTACVEANLPIVKEYEVPMIYAASGTEDLYNENATGDDTCVFPVQPVYVTEGKIHRNNTAVIYRGGKEIFKGAVDQLKRFKDDVKEVAQGFECGISFVKFNDIQEGDIVKFTTTKEIERSEL